MLLEQKGVETLFCFQFHWQMKGEIKMPMGFSFEFLGISVLTSTREVLSSRQQREPPMGTGSAPVVLLSHKVRQGPCRPVFPDIPADSSWTTLPVLALPGAKKKLLPWTPLSLCPGAHCELPGCPLQGRDSENLPGLTDPCLLLTCLTCKNRCEVTASQVQLRSLMLLRALHIHACICIYIMVSMAEDWTHL